MTRRQRATLLGLAAAIAIAAALIAVLRGDDNDGRAIETRTEAPATTTATATATQPTSRPKTQTIVLRDGKPVGGVQRLRFKKGSTIRFAVRSDVADEIHFHGYDVGKDVSAGGIVRFSVPATIDGRFVVELEQRATEIAAIEVVP